MSRDESVGSTEGGIMMTHEVTNGHVSSEVIEVELSEPHDAADEGMNVQCLSPGC